MKIKSAFVILLCIIFLLTVPLVSAQQGSIKLLAVSEIEGGMIGSMADMSLDLVPGSGRVFIDTMPASKIDTQLSTRFAKNIACNYADIDCSNLDFFYTIIAGSAIVGGPSAGAATAILTVSLLQDIKFDNETVITGTITSGNIIGPVGGLKEKIEVAQSSGFKRVLIPAGTRNYTIEEDILLPVTLIHPDGSETSDSTLANSKEHIDLVDYGIEIGIEVIEVENLEQALYYYTGKESEQVEKVIASSSYLETMQKLSTMMCDRSKSLSANITKEDIESLVYAGESVNGSQSVSSSDYNFSLLYAKANNLTQESEFLFQEGLYYSSASYCFGANTDYSFIHLKLLNLSNNPEQIRILQEYFTAAISSLNKHLNNVKIETITDLQAYTVAKDRLLDSIDSLNESFSGLENSDDTISDTKLRKLAYAIERIHSAESWMEFIGTEGKVFDLSTEELRRACLNKISEAEEQRQYLSYIYIEGATLPTIEELEKARTEYFNGNYELCLHEASLAKAKENVILGTVGIDSDDLHDLLDRKLRAAGKVIERQQERGIFPIMGFSYHEYAKTLEQRDIYLSLLYSEYALELSNFDMYFKSKKIDLNGASHFTYFMAGIMVGLLLAFFAGLYAFVKRAPVPQMPLVRENSKNNQMKKSMTKAGKSKKRRTK